MLLLPAVGGRGLPGGSSSRWRLSAEEHVINGVLRLTLSCVFSGRLGVSLPTGRLRDANPKVPGQPVLVHADVNDHRRPADPRDERRVSTWVQLGVTLAPR